MAYIFAKSSPCFDPCTKPVAVIKQWQVQVVDAANFVRHTLRAQCDHGGDAERVGFDKSVGVVNVANEESLPNLCNAHRGSPPSGSPALG